MPTHPAVLAPFSVRRLALVTSADYPSIQPDDAHLATSLERLGTQPIVCVWNDPDVDWSTFEAVLIRTLWDYFKHYPAFLKWLDRLDQLGIPTINDSRLLRWNSDKRYLLELAQHGVGIIPTRLASARELHGVLAAMPAQQVVIKPTISGGAWHTLRGTVGDAAFAQAVAQLPPEHDYLVQPFVPEIVSDGEWSLLYFAGEFSHAVIKYPASGDYRVQGEYGGSAEPVVPSAATLAAAERALAVVAAIGHGEHAYVRVDGVICAGQFLIMELELIEPFLHLAEQPQAAERLAAQIALRMAAFKNGKAPASEYLFSYGTLQDEAVQLATFGRRLQGKPDELHGYHCTMLEIRDTQVVATSGATHHPIVRHTGDPAHAVLGTLLCVTPEELARADAYEVEDYRRVDVTLASGQRAWVYVQVDAGSIPASPSTRP
ncbi:MAG: gamma-glutamylcyclotransferase [Rhodanobacter sp.]